MFRIQDQCSLAEFHSLHKGQRRKSSLLCYVRTQRFFWKEKKVSDVLSSLQNILRFPWSLFDHGEVNGSHGRGGESCFWKLPPHVKWSWWLWFSEMKDILSSHSFQELKTSSHPTGPSHSSKGFPVMKGAPREPLNWNEGGTDWKCFVPQKSGELMSSDYWDFNLWFLFLNSLAM